MLLSCVPFWCRPTLAWIAQSSTLISVVGSAVPVSVISGSQKRPISHRIREMCPKRISVQFQEFGASSECEPIFSTAGEYNVRGAATRSRSLEFSLSGHPHSRAAARQGQCQYTRR